MENKIEITEKETVQTVEIKSKAPMWKMPFIMGKGFKKLEKFITDSETKSTGAPYAHYVNVNWKELDNESKFSSFLKAFTRKWEFSMGFPVENSVTVHDNICNNSLPGKKYVQTIHKGPYHKISDTYKTIISWIDKNDIKILNESVEIYTNDPRTTKKENLETIVMVPIV